MVTPGAQAASAAAGRLFLLGASHHASPVALRERLAGKGGERAAEQLGHVLRQRFGRAVVLSTCNRFEIYCWSTRSHGSLERGVVRTLARWSGLAPEALRPYLYVHRDVHAARHLIRVASGLDSLALGESQILGQVRAAWLAARRDAPMGPELELLFGRAIEAARRIRARSRFDRHPSVASIAVEAAAAQLGTLHDRPAAVLGAGVTGKAATEMLLAAGARQVTLLNRSHRRAVDVESHFASGRVAAATLAALPSVLQSVDVLVCATSAPSPVVSSAAVAAALAGRARRPLVVVDIAVPRDVDPEVRALDGVHLIDLDDLQARCHLDASGREGELAQAEHQALAAAQDYWTALATRQAVPEIVALRRHAAAVREGELKRFGGRLRHLSPAERAAVEQLTHAIVQKLVHGPVVALRRSAGRTGRAEQRLRSEVVNAFLQGRLGLDGGSTPDGGASAGQKPPADRKVD